jgi:sugar lactone lactonase YvrE
MYGSHWFGRTVAALCALGITACSGLHGAIPSAGGSVAAPGFAGLPLAQPDAGSGSTTLFVGNLCNVSAINAFPVSANGNVAPSRTIVGANTSLNGTTFLSINATRLWATKSEDANDAAVLAFGINASGNVAPLVKITSANLWSPNGVVQDPANGNIFVSDSYNNRIMVFAKTANGNATPIRVISGALTKLNNPEGIFLAPSSQIGVVTANSSHPVNYSVAFFARTASGNVAPAARIVGASTGLNAPHSASYSGGNLYVSNSGANGISVFAAGATGNVAPIHTISGASTGLQYPVQIAFDSQGNLYAANYVPPVNSVTVFAAGAFGNVAPIRAISGSNTGLVNNCPQGIAVGHVAQLYVPGSYFLSSSAVQGVAAFKQTAVFYDNYVSLLNGSAPALSAPADEAFDSSGDMFVVDHALKAVLEYAPGAAGSAAPIAKIQGANTQLSSPNSLGLDAAGNIYVSNTNAKVTVFASGANGNVAPTRVVTGAATHIVGSAGEIAVGKAGDFYVVSAGGNNILHFAVGASGNAAPIHEIVGGATGISSPLALAVGTSGRAYEADAAGTLIRVFAPHANGNVAPVKTIGGASSGFNTPRGLALDSAANVYLSDCNANAVFVFGPGATGDVPPLRELGGPDHRFTCPLIPTVY